MSRAPLATLLTAAALALAAGLRLVKHETGDAVERGGYSVALR